MCDLKKTDKNRNLKFFDLLHVSFNVDTVMTLQAFHRFGQAKITYGGLVLGSS